MLPISTRQVLTTQLILFALLLWAGMVAGISFLEAPVKFTAPGVTLGIGLGIGRLVFGWLNKCEVLFCALVLAGFCFNPPPRRFWWAAAGLTAILALQTAWLLPVMDVRALEIIRGQPQPPSQLHWLYVGLEALKLVLLLGTAAALIRHQLFRLQPQAA
jgi:hypothetical protein